MRADITDIAQLKGKAIAISAPNAFPDLLARAALKKAGVDTFCDIRWRRGVIDGAQPPAPLEASSVFDAMQKGY